jgi:hypothetical protein
MAIAMSREIHFTGSDEILLIGRPILLGIAVWRYDLFKSYLMNPVLINLLAGGFLFYSFLLSFPNYRSTVVEGSTGRGGGFRSP